MTNNQITKVHLLFAKKGAFLGEGVYEEKRASEKGARTRPTEERQEEGAERSKGSVLASRDEACVGVEERRAMGWSKLRCRGGG